MCVVGTECLQDVVELVGLFHRRNRKAGKIMSGYYIAPDVAFAQLVGTVKNQSSAMTAHAITEACRAAVAAEISQLMDQLIELKESFVGPGPATRDADVRAGLVKAIDHLHDRLSYVTAD